MSPIKAWTMKLVLALLVVGATLLKDSNGYKDCIKMKGVPMTEEFADSSAVFHVPLHSDCINCEDGDNSWEFLRGRTAKKARCYKLSGRMKDGNQWITFHVTFKSKYATLAAGEVEIQGNDGPKLRGNMFTTKTDNKTYMAMAGCIFGKENFWLVASTHERLDDTVIEEILKDFEHRGFPTNKTASPASSVHFERFDRDDVCAMKD